MQPSVQRWAHPSRQRWSPPGKQPGSGVARTDAAEVIEALQQGRECTVSEERAPVGRAAAGGLPGPLGKPLTSRGRGRPGHARGRGRTHGRGPGHHRPVSRDDTPHHEPPDSGGLGSGTPARSARRSARRPGRPVHGRGRSAGWSPRAAGMRVPPPTPPRPRAGCRAARSAAVPGEAPAGPEQALEARCADDFPHWCLVLAAVAHGTACAILRRAQLPGTSTVRSSAVARGPAPAAVRDRFTAPRAGALHQPLTGRRRLPVGTLAWLALSALGPHFRHKRNSRTQIFQA